jgi:hypothetical protein
MEIEMFYQSLYHLQDSVLQQVFAVPGTFYLTGGTVLSRFCFQHRYSDDLDFFTHEVSSFGFEVREIIQRISRLGFSEIKQAVDSRDFKRILVQKNEVSLKIDFVADRVKRIGVPEKRGSFLIDTLRNILSNKLCSILNRDEPRDLVDILWICRNRRFNWPHILQEAGEKEVFALEDLLYRLKKFPLSLIKTVSMIQAYSEQDCARDLPILVEDILTSGANTLAEPDSLNLE